jgi:hypothetical protein
VWELENGTKQNVLTKTKFVLKHVKDLKNVLKKVSNQLVSVLNCFCFILDLSHPAPTSMGDNDGVG